MIKQGIRKCEFGFASLSKIYIHPPGIQEYVENVKVSIKNSMEQIAYYRIQHELFEMLDDRSEPCQKDPQYKKDICIEGEHA